MKINGQRVRRERQNRAWSQEHLATVSGLGVRTIHRIEKDGTGSLESAKALAAVFCLNVADLQIPDHSVSVPQRLGWMVPVFEWLVRQARSLDSAILAMKGSKRLLISVGCLGMAMVFYTISFSIGSPFSLNLSGAFAFIGAGFELLFWQRLYSSRHRRKQPLDAFHQ